MWLARTWTRRRAARQLAEMKARAALAEERTRIARDLHDDLGANLARIGFLTELAERALAEPERARHQLGKIYTTTRDLTRQLDSVVWAVDPANDNLESLVRYIHGLASEYLGLAGIRCAFTNTDAVFSSLEAGACGYLQKPVKAGELIAAARDVMAGGSPMSAKIARLVVQAFKKPAPAEGPKAGEVELTTREQEVLDLLVKGFLYKEIADQLEVSGHTVHFHIRHIYQKLQVRSRAQAVAKVKGH
jgi:DNA-binding CsgD family transcriptional regulator